MEIIEVKEHLEQSQWYKNQLGDLRGTLNAPSGVQGESHFAFSIVWNHSIMALLLSLFSYMLPYFAPKLVPSSHPQINTHHLQVVNSFNQISSKRILKLVCTIFLSNVYFSPNDSPSRTMKNVFISSKKPFLFSRYSSFCISFFPSFSLCQPFL